MKIFFNHIRRSDSWKFPKQSLRCRVLAVLIREGGVRENATVNSDQEKCILGDTCARLVYAKQQVASSNINIYNRKSTLLGPDRERLLSRLRETAGRELKHQYLQ